MSEPVTIDVSPDDVALPVRAQDMLTDLVDDQRALDRAVALADEFRAICAEKKWAIHIGGSRKAHLVIEAWQYLGQRMGLTTRTEWVHEVRHPATGDLEGYEARVQVIRVATGDVLGAAQQGAFFEEQMGGRRRWTERHAAMGMAQTRASSRAISSVARFVAELAGFSGTPAEEMPRDVTPAPAAQPAAAPAKAGGFTVSPKQRDRMFAKAKARYEALQIADADPVGLIKSVLGAHGLASSAAISSREQYEAVCDGIDAWTPPASADDFDTAEPPPHDDAANLFD